MDPRTLLTLAKILDLILLGTAMAPAAKAQARKLTERLRTFAAERRGPTPEEQAEIDAHTDGLIDWLMQNAADRPA